MVLVSDGDGSCWLLWWQLLLVTILGGSGFCSWT